MNRPPARDQRSVLSFLNMPWTDPSGVERTNLARADTKFIYEREDLVSLKTGRENAWLDATVERLLKYLHCRPVEWMFCSEVSHAALLSYNFRSFVPWKSTHHGSRDEEKPRDSGV